MLVNCVLSTESLWTSISYQGSEFLVCPNSIVAERARKVQTNHQLTLKEMKASLLLNSALWLLLSVGLGESIRCFSCHDSENGSSCRRHMNAIDCSSHAEFGDEYDSCFSMKAYRGKRKIQIKDCAIGWACKELEDVLCKSYNNKQNSTEQSCKVECCKDDFCNDNLVGASNSARSLMTTQTTLLSSFLVLCCALTFVSPWWTVFFASDLFNSLKGWAPIRNCRCCWLDTRCISAFVTKKSKHRLCFIRFVNSASSTFFVP